MNKHVPKKFEGFSETVMIKMGLTAEQIEQAKKVSGVTVKETPCPCGCGIAVGIVVNNR